MLLSSKHRGTGMWKIKDIMLLFKKKKKSWQNQWKHSVSSKNGLHIKGLKEILGTFWWSLLILLLELISLWFDFSSVQLLRRVWLFATPWTAACQASLSITNYWSLPKTMSIELVMPSNHLILCCPLLLLPSIFPSIRVFSNESALRVRWPKYWSFSFNISPTNEYPGLISFRMDWLDLLAVQRTLKSLLQHHSSKASILWHSAFFIVQFSHPYMTTGKTIALTRRTFVDKVMSLLFNMLSRLAHFLRSSLMFFNKVCNFSPHVNACSISLHRVASFSKEPRAICCMDVL